MSLVCNILTACYKTKRTFNSKQRWSWQFGRPRAEYFGVPVLV